MFEISENFMRHDFSKDQKSCISGTQNGNTLVPDKDSDDCWQLADFFKTKGAAIEHSIADPRLILK